MKILLLQNMLYVPTLGGANKLTRTMLEALVSRGHTCTVVAPATGSFGPQSLPQAVELLRERRVEKLAEFPDRLQFSFRGVQAVTVLPRQLREIAIETIHTFNPDVLVVTAEDPGQLLLEAALELSPGKVVYLVQTPWSLPFGKGSINQSASKAKLVRAAARIVTISHFLRTYMLESGGVSSIVMRFPVFGSGPFSSGAGFGNGYVTFVNPSKIKGITVFVELARRLSDVRFAVVPTWATTSDDLQLLRALPQVTLLEPQENIDLILSQTTVLLVPSLWDEAFGYIVIDAMLRGIPVLASNVAGLVEAKLGVDYLVAVRPIELYEPCFDQRRYPVPIVPEQNIDLWADPLRRLMTDRIHYGTLSESSRTAASAFFSRIDIREFEQLLIEVVDECRKNLPVPAARDQNAAVRVASDSISPARRAVLAIQALKSRQLSGKQNSERGGEDGTR